MNEFENNLKEFSILKQALQAAQTIFLSPSVLYEYDDIIRGVMVNGTRKKAVNLNTTQAFGKKLNVGNFYHNKKKAMEVCDEFFLSKKDWIISKLCSQIRTREEMGVFEHELFMQLKRGLLVYSTPTLIGESYNRIRKVVELYLEHIVAMAREIDTETRKLLTPLLFLPIDSWIIKNEFVFDNESIDRWGLKRSYSFGEIKEKSLFDNMQQHLVRRANEISMVLGAEFHVIYFDIFWNNRFNAPGGNLFGVQTGESLVLQQNQEYHTSYPTLLKIMIDELTGLGIYKERSYTCVKRKNGEYICEVVSPRSRRKNIVTIWPNAHGGGDIRIVGIGKYEQRRCFDKNDIGTSVFQGDLLMAYKKTQ
ncbi:MAG TPA: hypothetical protein GX707_13700 [Epulopiscium sp.]|nr:hypothetical protein [Candidatus Epulonipiscium sp.]